MVKRWLLGVCLGFISLALQAVEVKPNKEGEAWVYSIKGKNYAEARDDLAAAIEERGMVISAVSHVKDMLDRTSADLGYKNMVYATGGETVMFCKADLSQSMMRDNPHNIALCPYGISIYTLNNAPNVVYLSYRNPPSIPIYKPIHQLLDSIIQQVAQ